VTARERLHHPLTRFYTEALSRCRIKLASLIGALCGNRQQGFRAQAHWPAAWPVAGASWEGFVVEQVAAVLQPPATRRSEPLMRNEVNLVAVGVMMLR
jgi:hypothetical protein